MKNLNFRKKACVLALTSTIAVTTLTGCGNRTVVDTQLTFNKALIFSNDYVTIVEIQKWADYDGEQLQIKTKDGLVILTSSFDTKLIDDRNSDISAEDIARSIMGEDVTINYLNDAPQKTR